MTEGAGPTLDRPGSVAVEAAARQIVDAAVRGDSAFAPGSAVWTSRSVAELVALFVDQPDVSGSNFDEKLGKQLADASDSARQLFAELFYLNLMPLADYAPATKRKLIGGVLGQMQAPVAVPADLDSALGAGVFNGGVAFKTRRYDQLCLLIEVARRITDLPEVDRREVFASPLDFRSFLSQIVRPNEPAQRQSLMYLVFPRYFLPILKDTHRKAIRNALLDYLPESTGDLDEELHLINAAVIEREGHSVDYYLQPWRDMWDPKRALGDEAPDTHKQRGWLVRGNLDLASTWFETGQVTLAATQLRDVTAGIGRDELKRIVDEDYAHASYAAKADKVDDFHSFLTRMQPNDVIVTVREGRLRLGTITGSAAYELTGEPGSNLSREVDWTEGNGFDLSGLPGELTTRFAGQHDIVDLTQQLDLLLAMMSGPNDHPEASILRPMVLRNATPELAQRLHVDQTWLQECIDLLNDRPQLIFYGPPGTGKTFIAQDLARHVAGDNVRLVQFHPSYSYEDFFEGFRPTATGGFELRPGPMRRIVDQSLDQPSVPHVLIIDEINRGNLAKVFGELYFLLEYRDNNVELLYGDGDFSLPKNVYILGTMNTADRSIALVDAAMRRRFAFLPLHPSEPPTRDVLRAWLARKQIPGRVADLLDELNNRIADPDFKIGPSYFMRDAVHVGHGLERTWRTSILPLLEEHHFGELSGTQVAARYGYAAIAQHVDRASEPGDATPSAD